ncbi:universal stress protein [Mycobacterium sp. NPDC050441]|uniref:universal stress protein n=1 Tax=Mycobacterium sp. NPDC050441 TaxID=3155403 RepID=UPI0033BFBBCA
MGPHKSAVAKRLFRWGLWALSDTGSRRYVLRVTFATGALAGGPRAIARHRTRPVVVGIDGSRAALRAVRWGIAEAVSRGAPLRLIYATSNGAPWDLVSQDAADLAAAAVTISATTLKATTTVLEGGQLADALISDSFDAALVCVGDTDMCTAATVAANAHCPVVIVHGAGDSASARVNWVVVPVGDSYEFDWAIYEALDQARLRQAKVLAVTWCREGAPQASQNELGLSIAFWRRMFVDVPIVSVVADRAKEYLDQSNAETELLVVARSPDGVLGSGLRRQLYRLLQQGRFSTLVVPS